jgi:acyl-CoA synthetase (AMP-forming)/AMP-acid ligase II
VDLRIVDDDGNPVAVNEIGEIICQSPLATAGYYMNPEATNASFRNGWFHTGDLGYFDEEGYLFVVGRKKDMVKAAVLAFTRSRSRACCTNIQTSSKLRLLVCQTPSGAKR